ncbi:MAG: aminomethyl-transferring glycine dehydrogenase subunit GcvPB, partial [Clostridia bacterium]|nr:aminomethyl-transferring glycine dehydrogenase subunit GcvPB [Clostridia bacterium]
MKLSDQLIFEKSHPTRFATALGECDVQAVDIDTLVPPALQRETLAELPQVSEGDFVRHYTALSNKNYGVDSGFYPLGSCTMKYNPKLNETMARLSGFNGVHPNQSEQTVQGCLQLMHETDKALSEITGMHRVSLQPAAGAHGEMCGLMIIKQYHNSAKDFARTKILIPDTAHGTNPASAAIAGFDVVNIKSDEKGLVDIDSLREALNDEVAGLMLTNPNTLGLFDTNIKQIADLVHDAGGLLYYDGANANAILGISRPGDMGFDVVHLNLHKTFATPHGGGGPGSGPVGVSKSLEAFLPTPTIEKNGDRYYLDYNRPQSVGRIKSFFGNFGVVVRAYTYILTLGSDGLKNVAQTAVLNANYIKAKLQDHYDLPYTNTCMHEVVFSGKRQKEFGVSSFDIAKRLIDYGYHPPTMYFPLTVKEALMIEPTETESKQTIDEFIAAMI